MARVKNQSLFGLLMIDKKLSIYQGRVLVVPRDGGCWVRCAGQELAADRVRHFFGGVRLFASGKLPDGDRGY